MNFYTLHVRICGLSRRISLFAMSSYSCVVISLHLPIMALILNLWKELTKIDVNLFE